MRFLFTLILTIVLFSSCKHDHSHGENGDHTHSHNSVTEQAHKNGHDHDGHNHADHDGHNHAGHDHDQNNSHHNIVSSAEKAKGWSSLFDGKSITAWRGYKEDISAKWVVENGTLHFNPEIKGDGGDIISTQEYENFEFSLEWKIADCGNSGIFWNIVESDKFERTYHSAPEMQVLDNKCHPDAKIVTHRAGDLYDLIETSTVNVKPAMQWNQVVIHSKDGHYIFYQNEEKVVEFTMHTPEWDAMIEKSKFKDLDGFGKAKKGHIGLQDHGDKVWFRNIKIRTI